MPRESRKRVGSVGDVSLDGGVDFGVPIGNLMGKGEAASTPDVRAKDSACPADGARVEEPSSGPLDFLRSSNRVILRTESAGRGGRTVTVVEARPFPGEKTAAELAKMMRKDLGCGSHVEGARIILQGDMGDRAASWLAKRGVAKITAGN